MSKLLNETSHQVIDVHSYVVCEPSDLLSWLDEVADSYVTLRTECAAPLPAGLSLAGIGIVDTASIQKRLAKALVPVPSQGLGPLGISRSDLSEVAGYLLLEDKYDTLIGYKLVRDRELVKLPGRGIDAIGIEEGAKLKVVLSEIKFSDQDLRPKPPGVVDAGADCMRAQHIGHLSELEFTVGKILDCGRRAKDERLQALYFSAAIYLEHAAWESVDIISSCILVRPKERHSPSDFGTFKGSPTDFAPGTIRFVVINLPGTMDEILAKWGDLVEKRRAQ
ncbi:hypothetical protein [Roseomonas xinghualingensis]|uniref:hypothetical protein n=1 Tax=Roseomonas xinghualingensis TaxID=2986475 RepID=UPI0021F20ECE|nr:hypothetical protein [Roseomonas sp. SXEYE001]MCV4209451.1 hypothetical protein [Roseomonas sp. SXEYE001]